MRRCTATRVVLVLLLSGCSAKDAPTTARGSDGDSVAVDSDGDGTSDGEDCKPEDALIHPGATEICNGQDDDCNGEIDDGASDGRAWYGDTDGDGHFGELDVATACVAPEGYGAEPSDCDDSDPAVHPGAREVCDDHDIDEDCDGLSDDDDDSVSGRLSYAPDADGDGYGDASATPQAWCDAPSGLVADTSDCDDRNPDIHPGASEEEVGLLDTVDLACDGSSGSLALADIAFLGEGSSDYAGWRVSTAGDVDGDGLDDILVAARGAGSTDNGRVYLFFGHSLASSGSTSLDLADADVILTGEGGVDYAGQSVSSAGDVDGDGFDDLLIGAFGNNNAGSNSGAAYVVLGSSVVSRSTDALDLGDADFILTGPSADDLAGASVSAAGDVDGDGLDDLIIGGSEVASGWGPGAGEAWLVLGSTLAAQPTAELSLADADTTFVGETTEDLAGFSVGGAGDVDGDGLADLIIGGPGSPDGGSDAGKSWLVLGSTLAATSGAVFELADADVAFIGEAAGDFSGASVSSAGDVDDDGLDDLLVGTVFASRSYVILGGSLAASTATQVDLADADFILYSVESLDRSGESLGAAGDVDGDGYDDLIIGARYSDAVGLVSGRAWLVLGRTLLSSASRTLSLTGADFEFIGEASGDNAGNGVATAGDVNGDGLDDLLVGAPNNADRGSYAGKAYLILSRL